tara:strand:+ start:440 stop:1780 length:1341 start_codon:yes stop_codon:yes gene_type:complete
MMPWLLILGAALCVCIGCSDGTSTSAYPNRDIRLIVPFSPGGESDGFARLISNAIREHNLLDVSLYIENKGGAGATIGSREVKDADPDGYTMLILHEAMMTAQVSGKADYGPDAFTPVAASGKISMVIAVSEKSSFQSLGDLMEESAKRPEQLIFAANLGAPVHYAGLILESYEKGSRFRYTQTGGGADRFAAVKGRHADVSAFSFGEYIRYKDGGLRALAIFAEERNPKAQDIPTAKEQGYPFVHSNMHFWWFPKGTPQSHVDLMSGVIQQALKVPEVQETLDKLLCEPVFIDGREMKSEIRHRLASMQRVSAEDRTELPDIPFWVGLVTLGCFALVILEAFNKPSGIEDQASDDSSDSKSQPYDFKAIIISLLATAVFIAIVQWTDIPFSLVSIIYMLAVASPMLVHIERHRRKRAWVIAITVAVLLSGIIHFVFTSLLGKQLP